MPKYSYTGQLVDGKQVSGLLQAADPEDLQRRLLARGIFITSHRVSQQKFIQFLQSRLRQKEITRLTRQLAALVSSGITFNEALRSVREQITDKTLGSLIEEIAEAIEAGKSIADSFGQFPLFFDTLFTSLLHAGEVSGTLDVALNRVASYRERSEEVTKKIRAALAYPLLVLVVTFIVLFVLVIYIIPIFATMYQNFGSEMPLLTQKVVAASEFIKNHVYLELFAVFAILLSILVSGASERVRYHMSFLQLKIPLVNRITIKIINARFASTLGILLQSGVPMLFAVDVSLATTGNRFLRKQLMPLIPLLSEGKSLTEVLGRFEIFSKTLIRMSAAGEKTGQLGKMLSNAAEFYESEVDHDINTLTTLFEPLVIMVLGIFIAFILIAMYLPLFNLMHNV